MSMKNREFTAHGVKFVIVESNNADFKWQAMRFDENYNAWVRTMYYANTQLEIKENVKGVMTTSEETAEETAFYLKSVNGGDVIDLETYFRGCYYSFIDIYKHDIDILDDYFNGDFEIIEDTTYNECVDIINSYIENWVNDDNNFYPCFSDGTELTENDFEFTDYMDIYENIFDEYRNACRLHFNIYS